jgi:hypothetical protein
MNTYLKDIGQLEFVVKNSANDADNRNNANAQ